MKYTAKKETAISELLKEVQLSEVERWEARGHAARAEAFAELFIAALRGIRGLAHAIERTSRLPARTAS